MCHPASGFGEEEDCKPRVREGKTVEGKDTVAREKDRLLKSLLKRYADWMMMLMRSMDKITGLVPISPNSSKSEEKTSVVVTKELLTKFSSAEASINSALVLMRQELEAIYELQHTKFKSQTSKPRLGKRNKGV
jgi:hypothetical protein